MSQVDELACTYAALILHDSGVDVSSENINTIVTSAGIEVQPFWPNLFAKILADGERSLDDIILNPGAVGGGAGAAPAAGGADAAVEEEVEEEEPEPSESDSEMGMSFFGDSDSF